MSSPTRNRNDVGGVPNDMMAKMYGERAVSAGLLFTECCGIEPGSDLAGQFIEARSNQRTDEWGGSSEKHPKFILEVIRAFIRATGDSKKVGIKLSPAGVYNDMGNPTEVAIEEYTYLIKELDALNIGYIQLARYLPFTDPEGRGNKIEVVSTFRPLLKIAYCFVNGGLNGEEAEHLLDPNYPKSFREIHVAVFGSMFIANPNLMELIQSGQESKIKPPLFHLRYAQGPDGYINFDL
ncbi:hypothetical protein HK405_010985 [Cladochytrium tenue]|nr:hypothetical protein HK405_010985 [Cladochytrium tenue]